jgi:hypothetical protein
LEVQVKKNLRRRFWVEIGVAAATVSLSLVTSLFPDWIELVSGWDPDQYQGSVEWLIVIGLYHVTVVMLVLAAIEWRRVPAEASA